MKQITEYLIAITGREKQLMMRSEKASENKNGVVG